MTTYPATPAVPSGLDAETTAFLRLLKQNVDLLTGAVGGSQPVQLPMVRVASLPANGPGLLAYAIDGRKAGEAAGKGSGVMIFSDLTKWCAVDTGLAVTR